MTLKVMQWNAEGLMKKPPELEYRMNKDNIDICCVQKKNHLQKDKTFNVRGYQCFRTDRREDRRKGGIIPLIKSNIKYVLHVAKECIPKGTRKDYKPYWNEDLNNKHNELTTARNLANLAPSIENITTLKQNQC